MYQSETTKQGITFYRTTSDINGNPRYIVHFLSLLNEGETGFSLALDRAHKIGGAKYRGRDFSGGIAFQSYNIENTADAIERVKKGK